MRCLLRVRGVRRVHALLLFVALVTPAAVSATELREGELVAAGSPVLQNASGTLRLEQGQLDGLGRKIFVVPEPEMLWQLGPGAGFLALLAGRRRRRSRHSEEEDAVMKKHLRSRARWLAILALTLLAAPATAQVPQDMTYTGRLVDGVGSPLAGPVDLELRVFDAETSGTQLYSEEHLGVSLDATGGFSVQLGLGTSPSGPFDADLFSEVGRWLEVVVGNEALTPRQIIGSVPWALVAQQANKTPHDCAWAVLRATTATIATVGCPVDKFVFHGECAFSSGATMHYSSTLNGVQGGGLLDGFDVTAGIAFRCLSQTSGTIDAKALCCKY